MTRRVSAVSVSGRKEDAGRGDVPVTSVTFGVRTGVTRRDEPSRNWSELLRSERSLGNCQERACIGGMPEWVALAKREYCSRKATNQFGEGEDKERRGNEPNEGKASNGWQERFD
jgi:hypothetical protein